MATATRKKAGSLDSVREKLATALQKLVRLKEAVNHPNGYVQCWSCGIWKHWKEMQGGHWIERTKKSTKTIEENIHPQCAGCNGFGWKYATEKKDRYCRNMRDFYGDDFCDELIALSNTPVKEYRADIEERLKEVRAQIKELEKEAA